MKTLYLVKVIGHDRPTMVFPEDGSSNRAVFRHITLGRDAVPETEWADEFAVAAELHDLPLEWRIQA